MILTTIRRNFDVVPDAEISVECNPDSVSDRLLHRLYAEGFNRVSLGVQSDDDEILKSSAVPTPTHRPPPPTSASARRVFATCPST